MSKKIFLFSCAGGSSIMYAGWDFHDEEIISYAIDYPGHGYRIKNPLSNSFKDMVADVFEQVTRNTDEKDDFFFLGHSMGGLIAWYVSQELMIKGYKVPKCIFLVATRPPEGYPGDLTILCEDDKLQNYMDSYNRVPVKRRQSKIYLNTILPMIKNDFKILSRYKDYSVEKLAVPIMCFYSKEDSLIGWDWIEAWESRSDEVEIVEMSGDHFFIEDRKQKELMVDILLKRILEDCERKI